MFIDVCRSIVTMSLVARSHSYRRRARWLIASPATGIVIAPTPPRPRRKPQTRREGRSPARAGPRERRLALTDEGGICGPTRERMNVPSSYSL